VATEKSWTQHALTLATVALGVLVATGLGIYTFLTSMATTLHPNPKDVPSVMAEPPAPEWAEAVDHARQLARAGLVEQNLPGLSVAVGVDGRLVWAAGFGWANVEKKVPAGPRTRFRIGHASKALTSAGVGLLLEQGRMRLDDEIQAYVPAFPEKQWPVTLRQLMGHVAGIRHYRDARDYMPSAHCDRAADGLKSFENDPLLFEPETQYKYSTFGWILVSAAVEAASHEPFFSFMRTQIFTPLGMVDTTPDSAVEPIPEHATFYYPRFSGDPASGPDPTATVDYSCFAGAGAFLSTPSDLVRFGIALHGDKLLRPATVTKLQSPQVLASSEETAYGLGWMLETVTLAGMPTRVVGHGSRTMLGGSTSFLTFPERGLVVAVTSNISKASLRSIALRIAQAFEQAKLHGVIQ
jgi:serine beta-lactamase-like protein LACTB